MAAPCKNLSNGSGAEVKDATDFWFHVKAVQLVPSCAFQGQLADSRFPKSYQRQNHLHLKTVVVLVMTSIEGNSQISSVRCNKTRFAY